MSLLSFFPVLATTVSVTRRLRSDLSDNHKYRNRNLPMNGLTVYSPALDFLRRFE